MRTLSVLLLCACSTSGGAPAASPDASSEVDAVAFDDAVEAPDGVETDALETDAAEPDAHVPLPPTVPALTEAPAETLEMPSGIAIQPALAIGDDGGMVLVFTAPSAVPGELGIWASLDGAAPVRVHDADTTARNEPDVCALAGGGYLATWSVDTGEGAENLGIGYRRLDATGAPLGEAESRVDTGVPGNHWLADAACLPEGGFALAGVRPEATGTTFAAFVQRFDAEGEPGEVTVLNEAPDASETQPVLAADGAGGLWAAWGELGDPDGRVLARHLPLGGPPSPAWLVAGASGLSAGGAAIAADPLTGQAVVAVTVSTPDVAVRFLSPDGPGSLTPLPADGRTGRLNAAVTTLGHLDAAAIIYLGVDSGAQRTAFVSYIGKGAPPAQGPLALDQGKLPSYAPAIAFRNGTLGVAWTDSPESGAFRIRYRRLGP